MYSEPTPWPTIELTAVTNTGRTACHILIISHLQAGIKVHFVQFILPKHETLETDKLPWNKKKTFNKKKYNAPQTFNISFTTRESSALTFYLEMHYGLQDHDLEWVLY